MKYIFPVDMAEEGSAGSPTQGTAQPTASAGPAWTAQLPKDLQGHEKLTKLATIGDLGKAYLELEGKSANAVIPPGEGATDDERAAFYERLGRPKAAEEYELARELPKGLSSDPEYEKTFKEAAHKAGLTKAQAQELFAKVANHQTAKIVDGLKAATAAQQAAVDKLKADWGASYDENVTKAHRAFKQLGSEELATFMEQSGLGNHPLILKTFRGLWDKIADDSFVDGDRPNAGKARNLAQIMYPNQA